MMEKSKVIDDDTTSYEQALCVDLVDSLLTLLYTL